ncbi:EscU/YscU/HrcU family type III secretion system export apparatus switch protein [Alphaproteobacteria bacterium]|jgi:flagellar biosynthesis protein FlhB|nr:EscU/YscU/HrcU family type III secretion system export apparatus switch protein [Alphaproteobacteria bacterium]MDC1120332.1 EscU/YscU/HrcU family type III secretion system export apparatus switch protein [Alphaproteobacteria bacterium]
MAEEGSDGQEKTEDPSQRKIDKSLEEGKVLKSQEVNILTSMAAGFGLMFAVPGFVNHILGVWGSFFHFERGADLTDLAFANISDFLEILVLIGVLLGIPLAIVAILTQRAVSGQFNFAPKAMAFKAKKMNPITGLGRMFGTKSLVELSKALLKASLLIGISAVILHSQAGKILQLPFRSLGQSIASISVIYPMVLGGLLLALAVIAIIDFIYQRHTHTKSLKMSKQEQKEEHKQAEGSPEVKAKIRRMQMEKSANSARQNAALDDVASATAIITNPTHFAVALKYDVGSPDAPKILAMGRGHMAAQIIERANSAKVTIFQNPLLARALYFSGEIGGEIPERLYQAVAVVLAYIYRVDKGEDLERPEVELPEDLQFNEHGNLMSGESNA